MKIKFKVTGSKRKQLVTTIAEITGFKAEYQYTPTYAYQIGPYTVTKDGTLLFEQSTPSQELLAQLAKQGFTSDEIEEEINLNLSFNRADLDDETIEHLRQIVWAKNNLIKAALGIEKLPLKVTEDSLTFPWFKDIKPENAAAYQQFISHLIAYAKDRKRVTAQPKEYENPRYAFRCFLLRLGFIGPEYKTTRKILLSKLTGSCAFKEVKQDEQN